MYKNHAFLVIIFSVLFIFCSSGFSSISKGVASEAKKKALMAELTGKDIEKMDDLGLYSELLAHYRTRDSKSMQSVLSLLLRKFPQSSYADNALYLSGELNLEIKNYTEALRNFQKVVQNYPLSNRVVSAYFARGLAYKKMNLESQAKRVFFEVRQKFPGSPEAYRADTELKLFR